MIDNHREPGEEVNLRERERERERRSSPDSSRILGKKRDRMTIAAIRSIAFDIRGYTEKRARGEEGVVFGLSGNLRQRSRAAAFVRGILI